MGNKSLLNLNKTETVFTKLKPATDKLHDGILGLFGAGKDSALDKILAFFSNEIIIGILAVAIVILFLSLFLRTRLGLKLYYRRR